MSNPRQDPNFYGYPRDIVVDLGTGKTTVHGDPLPRASFWGTARTIIIFCCAIPGMLWQVAFDKRTWLGQIEAVHKDDTAGRTTRWQS